MHELVRSAANGVTGGLGYQASISYVILLSMGLYGGRLANLWFISENDRSNSSRYAVMMFGVLFGAEDITKLMTKYMYTSRLWYDNLCCYTLTFVW